MTTCKLLALVIAARQDVVQFEHSSVTNATVYYPVSHEVLGNEHKLLNALDLPAACVVQLVLYKTAPFC